MPIHTIPYHYMPFHGLIYHYITTGHLSSRGIAASATPECLLGRGAGKRMRFSAVLRMDRSGILSGMVSFGESKGNDHCRVTGFPMFPALTSLFLEDSTWFNRMWPLFYHQNPKCNLSKWREERSGPADWMALLGKPLGWRLTRWPNRRDLWMVSQLRTESYQNDSQSSILTNKLPTFCDDRLPKINDKLPALRILHDDRLPTKTNPSPCALPSATLLCSCSNSELPGLALTWCLVTFWAFNFRIPETYLFYYFQTSSMNSNGWAHGPIWMYRA